MFYTFPLVAHFGVRGRKFLLYIWQKWNYINIILNYICVKVSVCPTLKYRITLPSAIHNVLLKLLVDASRVCGKFKGLSE